VTASLIAAASFGATGSVFGFQIGELAIVNQQIAAMATSATAMITCVAV
jgi:hypothetical protein